MKRFLNTTLIASAVGITLQAIQNIVYYIPYIQDSINAWTNDHTVAYGTLSGVYGLLLYLCFLLLGFAISSSREQLPSLSACMRMQMLIIIGMLLGRFVWGIAYYSIGGEHIPHICKQIAGYWTTIQNTLLACWLWQLACRKKGTFQSASLGKLGKISSLGIIVATILWIVAIILYKGDLPKFMYSLMTWTLHLTFIVLLGEYWRTETKQNKTNEIK